MRIVLTGGTGLIGRQLVLTLLQQGHDVTLLTRSPERAQALFGTKTTNVVWPEPSLQAGFQSALDGSDAVIHLAGEPIAKRWTTKQKRRIVASRVDGTRPLVQAVRHCQAPPNVFISASAVGFYGPTDEWVDEESPPGTGFLADVVQNWEAEARRAESLGLRVVMLRTGLFLSPDGGVLQRMLLPFKLFAGGSLGPGSQWLPWIHKDDWVDLVLTCLTDDRATGPVNVVGPSPVRMDEFSETLGKVLKRPSVMRVPSPLLRLALGEMSTLILTGQRVLPRKAQSLGFEFQYDRLDLALRNLLSLPHPR